jgi:hypothetical protein
MIKMHSFNAELLGKELILTSRQMLMVKGGSPNNLNINNPIEGCQAPSVGPLSATDDDKRRERPGGGISTH